MWLASHLKKKAMSQVDQKDNHPPEKIPITLPYYLNYSLIIIKLLEIKPYGIKPNLCLYIVLLFHVVILYVLSWIMELIEFCLYTLFGSWFLQGAITTVIYA